MTGARDPELAAWLERIAVPPASPTFWADLDRLVADAEPPRRHAASALEPVPGADQVRRPIPLAERRRATGRADRRPTRVVALAAAVALAVLVTWQVRQDDTTATVASRPDPPVTEPDARSGPATPIGAVRSWLGALRDGDLEAAAALTGPGTVAYETASSGRSPVAFLADYASEGVGGGVDLEVTEGLRAVALGEYRGQSAQVVVAVPPDGAEGPLEAFPVVRSEDGRWLVEPNAFDPATGGRLELISPPAGEQGLLPIRAGEPVTLVADGDGTFVVAIDQRPAVRLPADGRVQGTVGTPTPDDLEPGAHVLVVARIDDDVFTASALRLVIEAG